jgi:hypothetical protein
METPQIWSGEPEEETERLTFEWLAVLDRQGIEYDKVWIVRNSRLVPFQKPAAWTRIAMES